MWIFLFHLPLNLTITLAATLQQANCDEQLFAFGILTFNVSHIARAVNGQDSLGIEHFVEFWVVSRDLCPFHGT